MNLVRPAEVPAKEQGKEMKEKETLTHGGDWAGYEIEYGKEPLDFSMNVNPLGFPESARAAVATALTNADRYPDPLCRKLKKQVADQECVPEEWIFFGNGASDVIYRLALATKHPGNNTENSNRLLITAPTFSEYEESFSENGWEVERHLLREEQEFRIGEDLLERLNSQEEQKISAVFLCEPNNPTGVTTDPELLKGILDICSAKNIYLVVDECFNGFLDEPEKHSVKGELADHPNLIVLKAFTKLYGMAGIRLGYSLCSDSSVNKALEKAGPLWNVSTVAQEAGMAILEDREYVQSARDIVREERAFLKEGFEKLGITKIFGEANYLLFHIEEHGSGIADEGDLAGSMRAQGILIRDCSNYHGLEKGWYRVAVRTREENRALLDALKRCR